MKVTVLLPVYNAAAYVLDACNSILSQSFRDFELLIIDDGSTDNSLEFINSLQDSRIIVHQNESNKGLIATLNKGIDLAKGELIARMDADDISTPDRLMEQVSFMDNNPEIVISGGLFENLKNPIAPVTKQATDPEELKCRLFFHTVLAHPTVIYRRKEMIANRLYYNEEYKHAEDYELWVRASRKIKISNLDKVILRYRFHANQVSNAFNDIQIINLNRCRLEQLAEFGISATLEEKDLHLQLSNQNYLKGTDFVEKTEQWLLRLSEHNENVNFFDKQKFSKVIGEYWIAVCRSAGKDVHKVFKSSNLNSLKFLTFAQKVKYNFNL